MKKSVISFTTTIAVLFTLGACGSPEPTDPAQGEDEAGADESSEYPPAPEDPVEFAKFVVENMSTRGEHGAADFLKHYGSDWFQGELQETDDDIGIGSYVYGDGFVSMYNQDCAIKGEPTVKDVELPWNKSERTELSTAVYGHISCTGEYDAWRKEQIKKDKHNITAHEEEFSVVISPDNEIDDFSWSQVSWMPAD